MQLNPKAFALTLGIFAGSFWLLAMGLSLATGIGAQTITALGNLHPGFSYSWGGLLWMVILHFIGGTVLGWLFARLYNALAK